jgi:hypothetical protein
MKNRLKTDFETNNEIGKIVRQINETGNSVYNLINKYFGKYCITARTIDVSD